MSSLASITCSEDGTLHTYRVEGDVISPLATTAVGTGLSALAPDAAGTHAFAGTKEPQGIASLRLDPASGEWAKVGHTATDESWTYLTRSGDGRFLLGASYGGGVGRVWRIDGDTVGEATAEVRFANLHCVIELDGFAYFVSLGQDLVACYRLTPDGALEPLAEPTLAMPEGCGPRHLTPSADGRNLYLVMEFSGEVFRLARETATGVLRREEAVAIFAPDRGLSHSRFGADPVAEHLIWGADVHLHGNVLVASERCESTLASVTLGADGELGQVVSLVETEQQPRGFTITADGHVVCPGEKSDRVSLFTLADDGHLERIARVPGGRGGNWVRVLEQS